MGSLENVLHAEEFDQSPADASGVLNVNFRGSFWPGRFFRCSIQCPDHGLLDPVFKVEPSLLVVASNCLQPVQPVAANIGARVI